MHRNHTSQSPSSCSQIPSSKSPSRLAQRGSTHLRLVLSSLLPLHRFAPRRAHLRKGGRISPVGGSIQDVESRVANLRITVVVRSGALNRKGAAKTNYRRYMRQRAVARWLHHLSGKKGRRGEAQLIFGQDYNLEEPLKKSFHRQPFRGLRATPTLFTRQSMYIAVQ